MIGNLFISGQIGSSDGVQGFELTDLIQQVQKNKDAEAYNVYIDSVGGSVEVGFDIYNYLKSLGKPITTIGTGVVASIATVIFLAGGVRRLRENTIFMIHLPQGGVQGTSEDIENYNNGLKSVEKKLISFYKDITGLTEDALKPMLRNETFLTIDQAFDFGFTNEKDIEKMVAKIKFNTDMNISKEDKSWFENLFSKFTNKIEKPKNIMLLDATGVEINFPDVEEGLNPTIGSVGQIGDQPIPDGEYIMPSLNNAKVVFVGGVVTEIIEEDNADEEMEALKSENESLKTQLQELTAKMETEKETASQNLEALKLEFTNMKSEISAKFELNKKEPKEDEPKVSDRMAKLKTKLIKK